ncbi:uncharacterized protein [Nicotiana tomentosiformis]|uniref:uncharacterized protein n=1 Tax=Nicotiana tomentosiformis TaxID=4098 RepID=UPI00388CE251
MYQYFRQHYRWRIMKKDIVGFVAQCLNCQQAARDAEETALRNAQLVYEGERDQRIVQNQPLGARRPLGDYARPVHNQGLSSVRPPPVAANSFELKQGLLQTMQNCCVFKGKMNEDPNTHLMDFEEIMNTFQYNGVSQDAVYLRAFPSLSKTMQSSGFEACPRNQLEYGRRRPENFLINISPQLRWESLEERSITSARKILKLCLKHGRAGGPLMKKTPKEIVTILDEMSEDANQWPSKSAERRRVNGVHQVDANTSVQTDERLDAHGAAIKELGTWLQNLEKQVGQIATVLSERIPVDKKKKGKKEAEKKKKEETSRREEFNDREHMHALPIPQKLYREKLDKQFKRFLDMLKIVNVNLPFTKVLSQMPAYAKFLKEIVTKKRKIEEISVVKLTEHCSTILQNKLPQKCGDPGNQTTITPKGIVEDVLVKLDKFVFLVDFIVVKMEENKLIPLILGRPFLATGRAILDIHDRKLMLRVGEENVTFEMNVETGVIKEKPAASVEWKVKGSKVKAAMSGKDKCGVYPKRPEKKLSAWMCALVRACGMEPDLESDPD